MLHLFSNRYIFATRSRRPRRFLRTAVHHAAERLEGRRLLAAISWTGASDHSSWNQPGNWSTNTVPTATDDVTINSVDTIQSTSARPMHNLTLTNATLSGSGEVDVGGAFHWISGTLAGGTKTVIPAAGSLTLDTGNHQLNGELDLNGPATWTAGNIGLAGGNIVNNSTFTATTSATLQILGDGAGAGVFNNQAGGSFVVNGPGLVHLFFSTSAVTFNNAGTVNVQSGTLRVESGGTGTKAFDVAGGATLAFGSDYTFAAGSSASGDGASGTGSFQFTGGTQTLTADQTFPNLTLSSADTVAGSHNLTVTGALHWMSGTLAGGTTTIVPAAGSLLLDTGNHQLNGELDLNGPANWTAGNIGLNGGTIVNNATFTATPATSVTLQMFGDGGAAGTFKNQAGGSFVANGLGTVHIFNDGSALPFNNAGTVSVQAGTLLVHSGGMSTAAFTVASGATVAFPGDYTFAAGSSAAGAGSFQFTGGTHTLTADQTFPNLTLNNPVGTELGPGSLTVTGALHWMNGTLAAGTKTIVPVDGSLMLDTGNHQLNGELDSEGPANWTAGNIGLAGGTLNNTGTFTATAAATKTLQMFGDGGAAGTFKNQAGGSFVANGPGTVHIFNDGSALPFNNAGTVNLQSGTLRIDPDSSHSGDFDGQAGATLLFNGNQSFAATSHINGNLNLEIDSGTDTYGNGLNTTGTVNFHGGSFTIDGNATAGALQCTGGTGVFNGAANDASSLSITTGKLALGGALIIHYGGAPFLTPAVRGYLASGVLAASAAGGTLGYADTADGVVAGLIAGDFLIKPALPGDANLDGKVGFTDLVILARHYGQTSASWDAGDFNYDGKVDFTDLVALARHYGQSGPAAVAALAGRADLSLTAPLLISRRRQSRRHL